VRAELPDVDLVLWASADASYQYSCPLCEQTAKTESDLYMHLQVCDRKSRVCNELLGRLSYKHSGMGPAHGEYW